MSGTKVTCCHNVEVEKVSDIHVIVTYPVPGSIMVVSYITIIFIEVEDKLRKVRLVLVFLLVLELEYGKIS